MLFPGHFFLSLMHHPIWPSKPQKIEAKHSMNIQKIMLWDWRGECLLLSNRTKKTSTAAELSDIRDVGKKSPWKSSTLSIPNPIHFHCTCHCHSTINNGPFAREIKIYIGNHRSWKKRSELQKAVKVKRLLCIMYVCSIWQISYMSSITAPFALQFFYEKCDMYIHMIFNICTYFLVFLFRPFEMQPNSKTFVSPLLLWFRDLFPN
jgi:hypothetical protein